MVPGPPNGSAGPALSAVALGAVALGAVALGAVALSAVASGACLGAAAVIAAAGAGGRRLTAVLATRLAREDGVRYG